MPHDLKRRAEKQRLPRLIIGKISLRFYAAHFINQMTNDQTQDNAPEPRA